MSCTTLLVGKMASYDGSTMIARNDDSQSGKYTPKKLIIVTPQEQPRHYRSVISHVEIDLPGDPMRYSAVPNALEGEGIWAGAGVNAANVAMTATETIASNERVLGADPLVVRRPAENGRPEQPGGIGEEDLVTIVLPYIRSAREGVLRTAELLEKYGTYEMNGMAFADVNEIWWMETLGGHHWIAKRVPDDRYVVMPNESGIDSFDLADALGEGVDHMCSADLKEFMERNHLDLTMRPLQEENTPAGGEQPGGAQTGGAQRRTAEGNSSGAVNTVFNPRHAFGTQSDADHVYNTPRAWFMLRYFNPRSAKWDGTDAQFTPRSNDLPWSMRPERKITVEDFKYILSSHFQGTPYDPYNVCGDTSMRGAYRCIGVNRTDFLALLQLRPYMPREIRAVEWLTFGSNVFNSFVPFYPNTDKVPEYLSYTEEDVDTDSFYWSCRLLAALADAHFMSCKFHVERYQIKVMAEAHRILNEADRKVRKVAGSCMDYHGDMDFYTGLDEDNCEDVQIDAGSAAQVQAIIDDANEALAGMLREQTADVLGKVLKETSNHMKNAYARSDA